MYCEISNAPSKEMKLLRTGASWQEKQRSAFLCVRCGNLKKAFQKPVKDILFTIASFFANGRSAGDYQRSPAATAVPFKHASSRRDRDY
jgi:hypothetical protein